MLNDTDSILTLPGASSINECICPAETYLVDGLRDPSGAHLPSGICADCGEGLGCPLGSDLRNFEDFMAEANPSDDKIFPIVQAGYFAKLGELTVVYKCGSESDCPGGVPGTCADGRVGELCGHCPAGKKNTDGGCEAKLDI
eukprot:Skav201003  [mRNA]  locus=scaffold991:217212:217637:+ [translate_table: standard]